MSKSYILDRAHMWADSVSHVSSTLFNWIGFVDGTVIQVSRPTDNYVQKTVYNRQKRAHALKFQVITSPDGMLLHAYGPIPGRRFDITLWRRSGIYSQLDKVIHDGERRFSIYGDAAYSSSLWMGTPFQGANITAARKAANRDKSCSRVSVECYFMELKRLWLRIAWKTLLRIGLVPAGQIYMAAILLTNIRNKFYPNSIAQHFSVQTPSLSEYLCHKNEI